MGFEESHADILFFKTSFASIYSQVDCSWADYFGDPAISCFSGVIILLWTFPLLL